VVAAVAATTATRRVTSPASAQRVTGVWMRTESVHPFDEWKFDAHK